MSIPISHNPNKENSANSPSSESFVTTNDSNGQIADKSFEPDLSSGRILRVYQGKPGLSQLKNNYILRLQNRYGNKATGRILQSNLQGTQSDRKSGGDGVIRRITSSQLQQHKPDLHQTLINSLGEFGTFSLLQKIQDTNQLDELLLQVPDIQQFISLLGKVANGQQLLGLLKKLPDIDMVDDLLDDAGGGDNLQFFFQYETNYDKLIGLLSEAEDPARLRFLFEKIPDSNILYDLFFNKMGLNAIILADLLKLIPAEKIQNVLDLGGEPEFIEKLLRAVKAQKATGSAGSKTYSVVIKKDNSQVMAQSGWGRDADAGGTIVPRVRDLAIAIGYVFMPHDYDQNPSNKPELVGRYYSSHAELKMAVLAPNEPIGVNNLMCAANSCKEFFRALAKARGVEQIVADPRYVRNFGTDGSIYEIPIGELSTLLAE